MTALGSKIPILLVPGMHEPMFNNPFVQNNISLVKDLPSVTFLQPRVEEHKAKIPSLDTVIAWSIKLLSPKFLEGKSVLVTGGPTYEFIDRVRFIGNPSSGKMGYSVALEAWYLGANVTFIVGPNNLDLTSLFNIIQVDSASEMADHVITTLKTADFSIAIFSAAVADFTPVSFTDDKIRSSTQDLTITLKSTPKILKLVKELKNSSENNKLLVVGFKAEFNKSKQELQEITSSYITNGLADIMVANIIGSSTTGFQVDTTEVHIFSRQDYHFVAGPKSTVAQSLFAYLKDKK
jgi:phosphopantothenoylcysteine decarboxylase/phosphopantothenate--cysteine ligase